MATSASRVENLQFPWVFLRAVRDVDRKFEHFILRKVVLNIGSARWRLFPSFQKSLGGAADHVLALVFELGIAFPHFVPDSAQRVISQEFDNVARREELVAKGEFVRVARSLATTPFGVSCSISQFLGC